MTWFVRHVNRDCWVCQRKTKQVVSQEKVDMRGVSMCYRTCTVCNRTLNEWVAARMSLAETQPGASA